MTRYVTKDLKFLINAEFEKESNLYRFQSRAKIRYVIDSSTWQRSPMKYRDNYSLNKEEFESEFVELDEGVKRIICDNNITLKSYD